MSNWNYTQDAQQQALNFLQNQVAIIEPTVYRIQYPDIQYPGLIPVDTMGDEWAQLIMFSSMDSVGRAEWFHHMALDIPMADIAREQYQQSVEMASVGYMYTLQELGVAMRTPGTNLTNERASAAKRAYEEFVDEIALRGSPVKGWKGLINQTGIQTISLPADGTGTSPFWANKTAEQVLRDFNAVLSGMYTSSLQLETADTILLPIQTMLDLGTRMINAQSDTTILEWLRSNNILTATTGQRITIKAIRGLETAGTSGLGRMVIYRNDPQVIKMHIPMPHKFLPVHYRGGLRYDVPGIFRLGGVEIRRPGAMRYADGVA